MTAPMGSYPCAPGPWPLDPRRSRTDWASAGDRHHRVHHPVDFSRTTTWVVGGTVCMVPGSATDNERHSSENGPRWPAAWGPAPAARFRHALTGALLLLVGLGLLALVAKVLDIGTGAVLVVAFIAPVLAYLIVTGQLSEIGGGGLTLKFREAAHAPVDASTPVAAEEIQTVTKSGIMELERIKALDPETSVVLTLTLGPRGQKYDWCALKDYVHALRGYRRFRFVVFLNNDGQAMGYEPYEVLSHQLGDEARATVFLDAVNAGRLPRDRGVRIEFLETSATNVKALTQMETTRLDAVLMRDDQRRLVGIVEREEILARLVLAATNR